MESLKVTMKPHAICLPFPAQGHINPMFKLAKLLHRKGFRITFVNTEHNHKLFLKSQNECDALPDFQFETIPDGQSKEEFSSTQDSVVGLCLSASKNCFLPFCELIRKLDNVTCMVYDVAITFGVDAAAEFGIPCVSLVTTSACGFLAYLQLSYLVENGIMPPKDASMFTNGYLEKFMDWVPALSNVRLKDLPSFIINPTDVANLHYLMEELKKLDKCSAIVLNTFDAFESKVLDALSIILPPIYTLGPLGPLLDTETSFNKHMSLNLWKEESECLDWLNTKEPNSVVYVNFGSITVLTHDQLMEFAWGLANSNFSYLWVVRPDLLVSSFEESRANLPCEFVLETRGKCMLTSWCPQEKVLMHPSIGCFLTHCGWNSTLESVCGGVPMICWPFFAEQTVNCRFCCSEWGIGVEIDNVVKRDGVEKLLKDVMDGQIGKEMKNKVTEFKRLGKEATQPGGSSHQNLDKLITDVLLMKQNSEETQVIS